MCSVDCYLLLLQAHSTLCTNLVGTLPLSTTVHYLLSNNMHRPVSLEQQHAPQLSIEQHILPDSLQTFMSPKIIPCPSALSLPMIHGQCPNAAVHPISLMNLKLYFHLYHLLCLPMTPKHPSRLAILHHFITSDRHFLAPSVPNATQKYPH